MRCCFTLAQEEIFALPRTLLKVVTWGHARRPNKGALSAQGSDECVELPVLLGQALTLFDGPEGCEGPKFGLEWPAPFAA